LVVAKLRLHGHTVRGISDATFLELTRLFCRSYYPSNSFNNLTMPIYDITLPLTNELSTYPGDPGIQITNWFSLAHGDPANVTRLNFGAHTGTHVDAPAHFIPAAGRSEELALDIMIGEAQVIEVPDDLLSIDKKFVEANVTDAKRVLFKTRNSKFWQNSPHDFRKDFTYLELTAAEYLAEQGVLLVGIDYLSIEQFDSKDHPTHLALLKHGIIILEGLNLGSVSAGRYELICLPLRIRSGNGDGAPARAVLRTFD
jgi:arylformamidase